MQVGDVVTCLKRDGTQVIGMVIEVHGSKISSLNEPTEEVLIRFVNSASGGSWWLDADDVDIMREEAKA